MARVEGQWCDDREDLIMEIGLGGSALGIGELLVITQDDTCRFESWL